MALIVPYRDSRATYSLSVDTVRCVLIFAALSGRAYLLAGAITAMNIESIGWTGEFQRSLDELGEGEWKAARVAQEHRDGYIVLSADGELRARVSGKMIHRATSREDYPATGDWVAIHRHGTDDIAVIHAVLPRKSAFVRYRAGGRAGVGGRTEQQVIAANIDTCFLVCGLGQDYNPRRTERYLAAAWQSGAVPVIVLNKADLVDDPAACVEEASSLAAGVDVVALSACHGDGVEQLRRWIGPGTTAVFLGSSGVGKSTIVNRLVGVDLLDTGEIRADDGRGRHTTTHRELVTLPGGGVVIDTPGLRELQAWYEGEWATETFADIDEFAGKCRFRDCTHNGEPGCAVGEALERGALDVARFDNFVKMAREERRLEERRDQKARMAQRKASGAHAHKLRSSAGSNDQWE